MSAWFRRACDRAFNLGLSLGELTRRCHGATDRRDMVEAVVDMEAAMQTTRTLRCFAVRDIAPGELAERAAKGFLEQKAARS